MADVASYQGASSDPSIIVEKKLNSNSSSKSSAKLKKIYVGAKINSISQLDVLSKTVYLDLYLWFRGDSKLTMSEIELNNSIESLDWRKPLKSYSHKQQHYQLFHLKGPFVVDFTVTKKRLLGQHQLGFSISHKNDQFKFLNDQQHLKNFLDSAKLPQLNQHILPTESRWQIISTWSFVDIVDNETLGQPELLDNKLLDSSQSSRFNLGLTIVEKRTNILHTIPLSYCYLGVIFSLILLSIQWLYSSFSAQKKHKKPALIFFFGLWFIRIFLIIVLSLCLQIILLNWALLHLNIFYLDAFNLGVEIFWWLFLAHAINVIILDYIIVYVEQKMHNSVPDIVKVLIAFFVYLIISFFITAFVFQQSIIIYLTALSAIGITIGLAVRTLIFDIFAGISIVFEQPFKINDWIQIHLRDVNRPGGRRFYGCVKEMTWRTTRLESRDKDYLIIPNSLLMSMVITNFTMHDLPSRLETDVTLDHSISPERGLRICMAAVKASFKDKGVVSKPDPVIKIVAVNATGVVYRLKCFMDISIVGVDNARSAVLVNLLNHLHHAGAPIVHQKHNISIIPPEHQMQDINSIEYRISFIKRDELFKSLADDDILQIAKHADVKLAHEGDIIINEDSLLHSVFFIIEGLVDIELIPDHGKETKVGTLGPGDIFGIHDFSSADSFKRVICATTDALLYELSHQCFSDIAKTNVDFSEKLKERMSKRIITFKDTVEKEKQQGEDLSKMAKSPAFAKHLLMKIRNLKWKS
ncbi:MAG: mechanosensitive ion channel [Methylococcales bacterium]|jgi:small-conductance mechanosensitive channel|nr:mechanosensitive ion channel [Methylococcales bacterium]